MTLERPRASVNVHVGFQVAGRGKRLGAQRALVRLFLGKKKRKNKNQYHVTKNLRKKFFFLRIQAYMQKRIKTIYLDMCHLVVVKVAAGREPLATDSTLVRFLPTVDAPVGVEAARGGETLVANVAHVRPLPSVDTDMTLE